MMTVDSLRDWGANVDEAMARCLNNETFYLMLVRTAIQDPAFEKLKAACEAGNLDQAFDAAHSLKGTMANLALTPILRPVEQITEFLRARTEMDYAPLLEEIFAQRSRLTELL